MSKALIEASQTSISKGSKSFALASLFFNRKTKWAAWHLYSWCRYCDDQIDQAANQEEALKRLQTLKEKTAQAFRSQSQNDGVFAALSEIAHAYQIPERYALDLLRGMEMDVQGRKYTTIEDLIEYCYCVAGTVGLMMCHVMGLNNPEALKNAVHMGIAMQLTNISRDVDEDLKLGRIYFPEKWLLCRDVKPQDFATVDRRIWASLARQLVRQAQKHYELGYQGLKQLPWRAAWAVLIAAKVYARIGHKVVARNDKAWDQRCYVLEIEKLVLTLAASLQMLYFVRPIKIKTQFSLPHLDFKAKDFAKVDR